MGHLLEEQKDGCKRQVVAIWFFFLLFFFFHDLSERNVRYIAMKTADPGISEVLQQRGYRRKPKKGKPNSLPCLVPSSFPFPSTLPFLLTLSKCCEATRTRLALCQEQRSE